MRHEHRRWKVCFGKNFWGTQEGNDPGEELRVDREFEWHGYKWRIPAVYRCRQGLVVDFAMEVPQEELRAYMEKWGLTEDGECSRTLTRAEEQQMEQENPLNVGFCAELELNGMRLHSRDGCGVGYLPGEMVSDDTVAAFLRHYGLDETTVWKFWRKAILGDPEPEELPEALPCPGGTAGSGTGTTPGGTVSDPCGGRVGDAARTGKRTDLSADCIGCPVGNAGTSGL